MPERSRHPAGTESTLRSMADAITLPGFVNAHSHTFQRALRGRAGGGDFWAWRELMLADAERQTPASVRELYALTYAEMRDAGYTAVGEFHYLGVEEARAAAQAAMDAGVEIVLLLAAYARGGLARMRQHSPADYLRQLESLRENGIQIGLAPHSVRACPRDWLEELGRYAAAERLPLHVHACEQPREIEECLAEHGCRPIELLSRMRRTRTETSSTCSPRAARPSAPARRPRPTSRTASSRRPESSTAGSRFRSAPTRMCGSIRSRSSASSRGSPAVRPVGAASSRPSGCSASARTRAHARSGWRSGRRS